MAKPITTIEDLIPDAHNANQGTARGRSLLEDSLRRYGAGRSILADMHGNLIAGNKTAEVAAELGLPIRTIETDGRELVVVQRTDLDLAGDDAARMLAYADNRVGEVSLDWDLAVIQQDQAAGLDLAPFFTDDDLAAILAGVETPTEGLTDPDAVPGVPDEPITKPGDLWVLGRHRLLCGDSTVITDVERLMGGKTADLVFTDPPYNVGYDYATYDDTKTQEEYIQLLRDAIPMDGNVIVNNGNTKIQDMILAFGKPYHVGVWLKTNAMSPSAISNFSVWEPVFFYGKFKRRIGNDIFDYPISKQPDTGDHTCPKPIGMCVDLLGTFCDGELVYDPFLGSGSTLIACEQTQRTCYGVEIDPHYCDVIVARWEAFTGATAVREVR